MGKIKERNGPNLPEHRAIGAETMTAPEGAVGRGEMGKACEECRFWNLEEGCSVVCGVLRNTMSARPDFCPTYDDGSFDKAVRGLIQYVDDYLDAELAEERPVPQLDLQAQMDKVERLLKDRGAR